MGRRAGSGLVGKDGEDDIERVIVIGDGLRAAASKPAYRRACSRARMLGGPIGIARRAKIERPCAQASGPERRLPDRLKLLAHQA